MHFHRPTRSWTTPRTCTECRTECHARWCFKKRGSRRTSQRDYHSDQVCSVCSMILSRSVSSGTVSYKSNIVSVNHVNSKQEGKIRFLVAMRIPIHTVTREWIISSSFKFAGKNVHGVYGDDMTFVVLVHLFINYLSILFFLYYPQQEFKSPVKCNTSTIYLFTKLLAI